MLIKVGRRNFFADAWDSLTAGPLATEPARAERDGFEEIAVEVGTAASAASCEPVVEALTGYRMEGGHARDATLILGWRVWIAPSWEQSPPPQKYAGRFPFITEFRGVSILVDTLPDTVRVVSKRNRWLWEHFDGLDAKLLQLLADYGEEAFRVSMDKALEALR